MNVDEIMALKQEFEEFIKTSTGCEVLNLLEKATRLIESHHPRKGVSEIEFRQMFVKRFLASLITSEDLGFKQ